MRLDVAGKALAAYIHSWISTGIRRSEIGSWSNAVFDFADAVAIFSGHVVLREDTRQDYGEVRMTAVGRVGKLFYTVIYTDRDRVRWIITAWPSSRKERAEWQRSL